MYLEILDENRKEILSKLGFLNKFGFYMAGGTALALQIGHRTSLDFDFYTEKKFNPKKLREKFDRNFKNVQEIYLSEETAEFEVDGVRMSFFRYPYRPIKQLIPIEDVYIVSKEDIAAMKILAVSQRGTRRDFIDIFFLMKEFGLKSILEFTKEKYPMFNIYVGLQGLVYFKDAEEDPAKGRFKLLKEVNWSKIKKYIAKEVTYSKKFL